MTRIITARSAGFCFGVSRSVGLAEEALRRGAVFSLGELIHNHDEVGRLERMGLKTIHAPEELPPEETVLIRSHGAGRPVYDALTARGARLIDATCPKVTRIHDIVRDASERGRLVLIIGAPEHPEIIGITGWCARYVILSGAEELENYTLHHPEIKNQPVSVVFQTTQTRDVLENSKKIIKKLYTNCEVFDTICFATQTRQAEALNLASECDAVVVIGGKHSANSRHPRRNLQGALQKCPIY